ncbi:TPA: sugar ABC transporter ATP-binding protein, partial [Klebsiella pneumoniae]
MADITSPPLLRLEGISKRYGATLALNNVRFDLFAGEVHALMGENGAGKSTLMKILSGNEQRDSGAIYINGQEIDIRTPRDARKYGIAIIHQELNTVPDMTVAENLFLGQEPTSFAGILDRKRMLREAREKLDRINADIDPQAPLGSLSIGRQQMVEIARAVSENAKVLVLDEPTAALSRAETLQLYRLIEQMHQDGVGMVYISHRMEEVWQLANRVTVFRDGTWIGTETLSSVSTTDIVRMMVGRQIVDLYQHEPRTPGKVLLEVADLAGSATGPVSFEVKAGEVVSMSGLVGSGRTEVARLLFGADPRTQGSVRIDGKVSHPSDPTAAIADG